jgi:hypothetical protein
VCLRRFIESSFPSGDRTLRSDGPTTGVRSNRPRHPIQATVTSVGASQSDSGRNQRPNGPPVHRPRACGGGGLPAWEPEGSALSPVLTAATVRPPQRRGLPAPAKTRSSSQRSGYGNRTYVVPARRRSLPTSPSGSVPPPPGRWRRCRSPNHRHRRLRPRCPRRDPLAAHCKAHSPAHRRASKRQVRPPVLPSRLAQPVNCRRAGWEGREARATSFSAPPVASTPTVLCLKRDSAT